MEEIVMKISKILASVSVCALAASAMAISAFAEVTNGNTIGDDGKKFYSVDVMADAAAVLASTVSPPAGRALSTATRAPTRL